MDFLFEALSRLSQLSFQLDDLLLRRLHTAFVCRYRPTLGLSLTPCFHDQLNDFLLGRPHPEFAF